MAWFWLFGYDKSRILAQSKNYVAIILPLCADLSLRHAAHHLTNALPIHAHTAIMITPIVAE
ncbi:hypothetical protein [Faucicola atlantae]|uniref:hypothetical protein n=1 Tax=Faucicola atlantae TaxID=34059 RepID=UPI0012E86CA4|nr:hypothetical protein [Moraxella atlantae]